MVTRSNIYYVLHTRTLIKKILRKHISLRNTCEDIIYYLLSLVDDGSYVKYHCNVS